MQAPLWKSLISYSVFSIALINRMNYPSLASGNTCLQIRTCTCEDFPFHFLLPLISSSSRHIFVRSCVACTAVPGSSPFTPSRCSSAAMRALEFCIPYLICKCMYIIVCALCLNVSQHDRTHRWLNLEKGGGFYDRCSHQEPPNNHLVVWQTGQLDSKEATKLQNPGQIVVFLFSALSDHINVLFRKQPSPQIMTILYFTLFWFLVIQIQSGRWTCLSAISRPCLAVKMNKWADWQWAHTSTCS